MWGNTARIWGGGSKVHCRWARTWWPCLTVGPTAGGIQWVSLGYGSSSTQNLILEPIPQEVQPLTWQETHPFPPGPFNHVGLSHCTGVIMSILTLFHPLLVGILPPPPPHPQWNLPIRPITRVVWPILLTLNITFTEASQPPSSCPNDNHSFKPPHFKPHPYYKLIQWYGRPSRSFGILPSIYAFIRSPRSHHVLYVLHNTQKG